jgi:eukaryotic-like serine/threonine-protein kinase
MTMVSSAPKELFGYEVVSLLHESPKGNLYAVCEPNSAQLRLLRHVPRKTDADLQRIEALRSELDLNKSLRNNVLRKSIDLKINKKLIGGITEAGLLMELVDGEALDSIPTMDPIRVMDIFLQLAKGIAALHHQRYIHCDISPHHIMICSDGQVRLIDFAMTSRTGTLVPQPRPIHDFYGPEVARMKPVLPQTDIYSFGASMYWALTGKRIPNLKALHQNDWDRLQEDGVEFPMPHQINPAIPEPLSKLANWCCKLALGSRPADMPTVIAGFEKVRENI